MLSRTANQLFWMARHIERAENLARLLDAVLKMSLLPQSPHAAEQRWRDVPAQFGLHADFVSHHASGGAEQVLDYMVFDPGNPFSIHGCVRKARENAHAARSAMSAEMWETLNATWIHARERRLAKTGLSGIGEYFDWIKTRSSLSRGVMLGTLLRDDACHFIRLGTVLERADNTARMLNMLLCARTAPGNDTLSEHDQWETLLRSMSALEAYRRLAHGQVRPAYAADLLIRSENMPRSLAFCINGVTRNLALLENQPAEKPRSHADRLRIALRDLQTPPLFEAGLHTFLNLFIDLVHELSNDIAEAFLVSRAEPSHAG